MSAVDLPSPALSSGPAGQITSFHFGYENVLGTSLDLRVDATSEAVAVAVEERVLAEIDRLEPIFSVYNPDSELQRWQRNRGVPTRLSPGLREVLQEADHWQERTGGAFNPAGEAFLQFWREAICAKRLPSQRALNALRKSVAGKFWEFDEESQRVTYLAECPLSLNAIAKGYIVDRACDAAFLVSADVQGIILNIGGDLRVRTMRSETVGITNPNQDAENAPPLACVQIQEGALATSGDWRRGMQVGDRLYSHIIDPRTGRPTWRIRSASVIAPRAADADALATALSVLSPEESLSLTDALPGVGCLLVAQDGQIYRSAFWR
jgi:FAD:protein FMN transferase